MRLTKKAIEKRNETFRKASKGEKRRMIAQEVLDLLDARKIKAQSGIYLEGEGLVAILKKNPNAELRDVLPKIKNCRVCAIGGACLALANIEDKLKIGEVIYDFCADTSVHDDVMRDKLGKYFSEDELHQMEAAFETTFLYGGKLQDMSDNKRLRLIMENIVKNKKFKPLKEWMSKS